MSKNQYGNLQLPFYQRFDIFKVHFSLWILQVECLYGIYISVAIQLRERLLAIFGCYSRAAFCIHISQKDLSIFILILFFIILF